MIGQGNAPRKPPGAQATGLYRGELVVKRALFLAWVFLTVCSTPLFAGEYTGRVQRIDKARMVIVVDVDMKIRDCVIAKDTLFLDEFNQEMKAGLDSQRLKEGTLIKYITQGKKGEEVAKQVQVLMK
jgi:hypothetical protein